MALSNGGDSAARFPLASQPNTQGSMPVNPRQPLSDEQVLSMFDDFLYHGEVRDFQRAKSSYDRISTSLQTDDFDALVPPCLEVLEFANHFIRNDTLLCLMYISLGCTMGDMSLETVGAAMRKTAAILTSHDTMPMLVRSLDFLLGHDTSQMPVDDGMLEREFRLVFNCIYLQLLFNQHDEGFVHSLELGQGPLGASLVSLLFEATKLCAENPKLPTKKVVLLLLLVLRCLLGVPASSLEEMSATLPPSEFDAEVQEVAATSTDKATAPTEPGPLETPDRNPSTAAATASAGAGPPRLRELQAFAALRLHERGIRRRYGAYGRPAAIDEALRIIQQYEEAFLGSYAFHPSEVSFLETTAFLQDVEQDRESDMLDTLRPGQGQEEGHPYRVPEVAPDTDTGNGTVPNPAPASGNSPALALGQLPSRAGEKPGSRLRAWGVYSRSRSGSRSCSQARSNSSSSTSTQGTATGVGMKEHEADRDTDVLSDGGSSNTGASSEASVGTVLRGEDARGEDRKQDVDRRGRGSDSDSSMNSGKVKATGRAKSSAVRGLARSHADSPAAVFERLYVTIFPCLTELVVLLLRLLLTSCSNVENYPGVVDMARERHVLALQIPTDEDVDADIDGPEGSFTQPDEAAQSQRHREIMAATVSDILLILLKQARKSASEQFSSLAQLITDSNGALVVLKFLNQDLSSAMELRDFAPVLPCLCEERQQPAQGQGEGQVQVQGAREDGGQAQAQAAPSRARRVPSWAACATLRLLELLYLLCKDSPERVRKYLIHYKAPFILKRLHRIENDQVQRLVLKLLRKQVRYLPRKWKQTNMKAISAIYTAIPMSPLEDWLLNEPLYERFEGPSQADVRASNHHYNTGLLRRLVSGRPESSIQGHTDSVEAELEAAVADAAAIGTATMPRSRRAEPRTAAEWEAEGNRLLGYAHRFPEHAPPRHGPAVAA